MLTNTVLLISNSIADLSTVGTLRTEVNDTWEIIFMIFMMSFLASINFFWNKKVKQMLRAFGSITQTNLLMKEENILYRSGIITINILFLLSISFFLFKASVFYGIRFLHGDILSFLQVLVIVIMIFSVKTLSMRITGVLLKSEELFEKYNFNLFLLNNVLGLTLLPVIICISFFTIINESLFIYIGIAIIILFYLYRVFRGYKISRSEHHVSQLYIILYICTLEILPLVILTKVIRDGV